MQACGVTGVLLSECTNVNPAKACKHRFRRPKFRYKPPGKMLTCHASGSSLLSDCQRFLVMLRIVIIHMAESAQNTGGWNIIVLI